MRSLDIIDTGPERIDTYKSFNHKGLHRLDRNIVSLEGERIDTYKSFNHKGLHRLDREIGARRPQGGVEYLPGCQMTD